MNNIDYIIFKVLSNEATPGEKELFDTWLNADIANYSEFIKLKSYWKSEVVYTHDIESDEAFDRFKTNKLTPARNSKRRIRQIIFGAVSAAAVALILFTVGQPVLSPKDNLSFETKNQKDTLYLPDSTMVVLNKNSKVTYTSQYNKTERLISLIGEAYFDVKKNAKVPFIVQMEKCQITVLGTAFNVCAYTQDKSIKATLIRGVIRFDVDKNENEITLRPNQELKFNKLTHDITIKHIDVECSIAWMTELHRYQSRTLESFLKDFGVINNKQIIFLNKKLANTVISGSFRDGQSVDEILKLISRSVPIKWEINSDTIKITPN